MARFSLRTRTSNGTISESCFELIAGAQGMRLIELEIWLAAATASTFGLGRPAAIGVTPTSPVALLAQDDATSSALTKTAVAWGTKPTTPAAFIRAASFANVIGQTCKWTFANGLFVPALGTLVLFNITATGVADVNAVIDE